MDSSPPDQLSRYQHEPSLPAAPPGNGLYASRPRSTASRDSADALLFLARPAGWLIHLVAVLGEHAVRVSLALLMPDSYHNREVGMFQIKAEAVSVTGITTASATQPYMLRYKSAPVRLAQQALACVPLTLGIRGETQTASLQVLRYREGHGRHRRSGLIRVSLQPRAATVQLPQVYSAEIVVRSTLPWTKGLARGLKWTLCVWVSSSAYVVLVVFAVCLVRPLAGSSARNRSLLELHVNGKTVSELGDGDFSESTSKELLSETGSDVMKWRDRRSKRKRLFQTQPHGDRAELKFTEGSASRVAAAGTK